MFRIFIGNLETFQSVCKLSFCTQLVYGYERTVLGGMFATCKVCFFFLRSSDRVTTHKPIAKVCVLNPII